MGMGMFLIYLIVMFIQRFDQLMVLRHMACDDHFVMAIGFYNHFTHHHLPSSTLYNGTSTNSIIRRPFSLIKMISRRFVHQFLSVCGGGEKYEKRLCEGQPALCDLRFVFNHFDRFARESAGHMRGAAVYVFILLPSLLKNSRCTLRERVRRCLRFYLRYITNAVLNLFSAPQAMPGQQPLPSNLARANLLKNAFHYVIDSWGFGVGAGNVSYYLKAEPVYDTGGVVEVHNWLVEIMANFGVLTMLGYLTVYLFLFGHFINVMKENRKISQDWSQKDLSRRWVLVSSISPSSVSNLFFHWVFLSLVIAAVNILRRLQRSLPSRRTMKNREMRDEGYVDKNNPAYQKNIIWIIALPVVLGAAGYVLPSKSAETAVLHQKPRSPREIMIIRFITIQKKSRSF